MGHGTGRLIWCVNFTGACYRKSDVQRVQRGVISMLHTFQQYQMPATWMLPDPMAQLHIASNVMERPGQSVGLLAGEWALQGRNVLAKELSARVETPRAQGIDIHTVAVAKMDAHWDLLVRHQISAVRLDHDEASASSRRFGIWQASNTETVPGKTGFWQRMGVRRMVANAARNQQTMVITIDGDRVVSDDLAAKSFQDVCRTVARTATLKVEDFAAVGRRMVSAHTTRPARSILRAA